jgi:hypothetical protein
MTVYIVLRYGYSYGAEPEVLDVEGVFTNPADAQRWADDPPVLLKGGEWCEVEERPLTGELADLTFP